MSKTNASASTATPVRISNKEVTKKSKVAPVAEVTTKNKTKVKDLDKKVITVKTEDAKAFQSIYNYPADITSAEAKKKFRRQARATKKRLTKAVEIADAAGKPLAETELAKFTKSTYA